jgi:hypothetical protein
MRQLAGANRRRCQERPASRTAGRPISARPQVAPGRRAGHRADAVMGAAVKIGVRFGVAAEDVQQQWHRVGSVPIA